MGESANRGRLLHHEEILSLHESCAQSLSRDAAEDGFKRQSGNVLGARKIRRQTANAETDPNPVLLKINMGAGHGGASGRYDHLREIGLDYSFLLSELAIRE